MTFGLLMLLYRVKHESCSPSILFVRLPLAQLFQVFDGSSYRRLHIHVLRCHTARLKAERRLLGVRQD